MPPLLLSRRRKLSLPPSGPVIYPRIPNFRTNSCLFAISLYRSASTDFSISLLQGTYIKRPYNVFVLNVRWREVAPRWRVGMMLCCAAGVTRRSLGLPRISSRARLACLAPPRIVIGSCKRTCWLEEGWGNCGLLVLERNRKVRCSWRMNVRVGSLRC
jgi:hypothetical protein